LTIKKKSYTDANGVRVSSQKVLMWLCTTKISVICALIQSKIMDYDDKKVAGLLFIVAVLLYVLVIVISEAVYSGYSVGQP
jgi:hypothetical protein